MDRCPFRGGERHRTTPGVLLRGGTDTGRGPVSFPRLGKTPDVVRCLLRAWERHRTWAGVFSAGGKDTGRGPVFLLLGGKDTGSRPVLLFWFAVRNEPPTIRAFCRRRPRRLAVCRQGFGFPFALGLGRSDSMLAHLSFKLNPPPLICHKVVFALFTHLTPRVLLSTLVACRSKPSH